ncbi:hypothetical protein FRX31_010863 [Thalictrum thalictroides]|uniref:Uncharacterized protein n=1 Tax=Thalictrum thalictroides TaxID=46969 RepID=A0A7J6WQB6_THATH|nr:hypothetical protein FRX31_010863 [Thalictrum thalictroides]
MSSDPTSPTSSQTTVFIIYGHMEHHQENGLLLIIQILDGYWMSYTTRRTFMPYMALEEFIRFVAFLTVLVTPTIIEYAFAPPEERYSAKIRICPTRRKIFSKTVFGRIKKRVVSSCKNN